MSKKHVTPANNDGVVDIDINDIAAHPDNPRAIDEMEYLNLMKSLMKFPEMLRKRPLVIISNNGAFPEIPAKYIALGGNQRRRAWKELGNKTIPAIIADDWSEEQRAEFMIKDNVSSGKWNWDKLNVNWEMDDLKSWGLKTFDKTEEDIKPKERTHKGILVEFSIEDYGEAFELIKFWKESGLYIGGELLTRLREKSKKPVNPTKKD